MLSKHFFRVSLTGLRSLSNLSILDSPNQQITVPVPVRFMSKSLADEILKAKQQQDEPKDKKNDENQGNKKEYEPLTKWQKIGYGFTAGSLLLFFVGGGYIYCKFLFWKEVLIKLTIVFFLASPDKDENGHEIEDNFSHLSTVPQRFGRLKSRLFQAKKEIEEPFSDKLLPDPLAPPYIQPKYTICLEITGLLIHSNWTVTSLALFFSNLQQF